MSTSHLEPRKKPLDTFFWVNEVTGEVTYPPLEADVPAAPPEEPQELPECQRGSAQGAPPGARGRASPPAWKADSPSPPMAPLRHRGASYTPPSTPPHPLVKAAARSPSRLPAAPLLPPGGAPPLFQPLGPAPPPPASAFPSCPSVLWAYTCKLKNVLTGNNRFSF
uniref:Uncharacterized protein n=1 Tax=Pipistrellus kuhlii TaxID=59472 RepID=A0A7J7WDK2_PIPKU|nr:hypothetical protein mPipKuh1_008084 [Pipistrellus kuhlii]